MIHWKDEKASGELNRRQQVYQLVPKADLQEPPEIGIEPRLVLEDVLAAVGHVLHDILLPELSQLYAQVDV